MKYKIEIETLKDSASSRSQQSPQQVQLVFVGVLLFIVITVAAEYIKGDFVGLNIGEDFGLILGGTLAFGICVGILAAALRSLNERATHRRSITKQ